MLKSAKPQSSNNLHSGPRDPFTVTQSLAIFYKIGGRFRVGHMLRTWGGALIALATVAPVAFATINAARAEEFPAPPVGQFTLPSSLPALSPDCRSKKIAGALYTRPLRSTISAMRTKSSIKVLAVGSSSTAGVGASKPSATYVARLENSLEGTVFGADFDVVGRGLSGEVAEGQSGRMKREVEEHKPDLVIWQVGTNDAIRHVDLESFRNCLRRTLAWLNEQKIDVVLVDPQYGDALTSDAYYEQVVHTIAEVAREARVLLVDRFEAMKEIAKERGDTFYLSSDNLHLNDTGHRCMAEQMARAIVEGIVLADKELASAAPVLGTSANLTAR
jgi:acyl-CoA thioesterase I